MDSVNDLFGRLGAEGLLVVDPACGPAPYARPDRLPGAGTGVGTGAPDTSATDTGAPSHAGVTAAEVQNLRFNPTKFKTGYDQDSVDDFLDTVVAAIRNNTSVASPQFTAVKFREGYTMDEVDAAIDKLRMAGLVR